MTPGFVIEGHAIVSADGMIADGRGDMPPALHHPADFAAFQAALDRAAISVLGRLGHRRHPNRGRRRLVLTGAVHDWAIDPADPLAVLFNPAAGPPWPVLAQNGIAPGLVVVTGGRRVFDYFLPLYRRFVLAEVHDLVIPGGTPCFSAGHPRTVLAARGLLPNAVVPLDAGLTVTQTVWG